jgi:predicted naringenin-chalcone synthase
MFPARHTALAKTIPLMLRQSVRNQGIFVLCKNTYAISHFDAFVAHLGGDFLYGSGVD